MNDRETVLGLIRAISRLMREEKDYLGVQLFPNGADYHFLAKAMPLYAMIEELRGK